MPSGLAFRFEQLTTALRPLPAPEPGMVLSHPSRKVLRCPMGCHGRLAWTWKPAGRGWMRLDCYRCHWFRWRPDA